MATVLVVGLLLAGAVTVRAEDQTGRLAHGDVTGAIGWLHVNKDSLDPYNGWSQALFGSVSVGLYWTDHLKTEIQAGANNGFSVYAPERFEINGQSFNAAAKYTFAGRRLSAIGQYQFGHNQWFPPVRGHRTRDSCRAHLARGPVGICLRSGHTAEPSGARRGRACRPHEDPAAWARPGRLQRLYVHPRAFFLSNVRVAVGKRPEEVLLRFGLGVDF